MPGCGGGPSLAAGVDLTDVWIGPAGEVWAVGQGGIVGRRAPDSGAWCWCVPWPSATLRAVWGAPNGDIFVAGDSGTLLRFDGTRWLIYFVANLGLTDIHGTAADNVWVVGERGIVERFNGTSWQSHSTDLRYDLNSVWIDPSGVARVGGSAPLPDDPPGASFTVEAVVLRQDLPNSTGWTVEASFPQRGAASVLALSGTSPTDIWAVGIDTPSGAATTIGLIAHFDGTTWRSLRVDEEVIESRSFTDVAAGAPDGNTWVLGGTTGARFDGTTWTLEPALISTQAIDTRGAAMYAVGTDGLVMRWSYLTGWTIDRAATPGVAVPAP